MKPIRNLILILILIIFLPSITIARASKQLESFIKQREWTKVFQIANPGKDNALWYQTTRARDFLNARDDCLKQPGNLTCYSITIKKWKLLVISLNNKRRFSGEFGHYLNDQKNTFITEIKEIKKGLIKQQEQERIEKKRQEQKRIEKHELTRIRRQELEKERIKKLKAKKKENAKRRKQEQIKKKRAELKAFQILDNKATKLGYREVKTYGIAGFLYQVMEGKKDLEDGIGVLLWNKPRSMAARTDKKFKLLQIAGDILIYTFSDWSNDELIDFTIIIPKKAGGKYLPGQRLKGEYFTYVDNFEYITTLGSSNTAPIFKHVDLDAFDWIDKLRKAQQKQNEKEKKK